MFDRVKFDRVHVWSGETCSVLHLLGTPRKFPDQRPGSHRPPRSRLGSARQFLIAIQLLEHLPGHRLEHHSAATSSVRHHPDRWSRFARQPLVAIWATRKPSRTQRSVVLICSGTLDHHRCSDLSPRRWSGRLGHRPGCSSSRAIVLSSICPASIWSATNTPISNMFQIKPNFTHFNQIWIKIQSVSQFGPILSKLFCLWSNLLCFSFQEWQS